MKAKNVKVVGELMFNDKGEFFGITLKAKTRIGQKSLHKISLRAHQITPCIPL